MKEIIKMKQSKMLFTVIVLLFAHLIFMHKTGSSILDPME